MHRLLTQRHGLSAAAPGMAWFGHLMANSPALLSRAREQVIDQAFDQLAAGIRTFGSDA